MWTIIKFDKKNLEILKRDFKDKLGKDFTIYSPKLFTISFDLITELKIFRAWYKALQLTYCYSLLNWL